MNQSAPFQHMIANFVDRTSMRLFYDKVYTTRRKGPSLKALILLTDLKVEDLPTVLSRKEKLSRVYHVNVSALGEELYRVSLMRTMGLREIRGEVIIDVGCRGAWIVLTDVESYFITHVLGRLFDKLYPMVSRLYLNYSQMRLLRETISKSYQGKTTATFFTIKRERREPVEQRVFERKKGTMILWEVDADEEIRRLLTQGYVVRVDRIDFEVRDEDNVTVLEAQITRKGLCKLRFGTFSAFYRNVIIRAIEHGLDCKNFYDKRERSIEKGIIKLHPLQVKYPSVFDTEQLNFFAKRISSAYSCSIVHGGNPYFVADLCDCEDGSSFGVVILGDVVTVTPVTRATPQGISRLLDKIQEILGDGEIIDVKMG